MFEKLLEKAENQFKSLKPFVLYRKPLEHTVIGLFQVEDTVHYVEDYTKSGFVFAPFNAENKTIILQIDEKIEADFLFSNSKNKILKEGFLIEDTSKEFHLNLVKKGIEAIESKSFIKVVLSRKIEIATKKTPFQLFQELLNNYNNAFCYLWYHPKIGLWLGATPEILLQTENKQLKTMSLAGTQKYTGSNEPVWGSKELKEQELVTTFIAEAIKPEVDQVNISETKSVRAGNLWHLRTSVSGRMKGDTINSIVKALHPTPAVCGLPKKETKEFILKNENYEREFYTGFLGELNFKEENSRSRNPRNTENQVYKVIKNTTSLYVNLRCMQIKNEKAFIYIGGGITKDSDPIKEWEETEAKSKTMLKVVLN